MNKDLAVESESGKADPLLMIGVCIFIVVAAAWGIGWRPFARLETRWKPGVIVKSQPTQLSTSKESWSFQNMQVRPLASFSLAARLLMNIRYSANGDEFAISPRDLVVGWGPMSDSKILSQISFSHGYRYVYFMPDRELGNVEIGSNVSHIHAIPANSEIASKIRNFNNDDIIYLNGYLVSVEMQGMNPWTSSLTRFDNGCEIIWIDQAELLYPRPGWFSYLFNPSSIVNPKL